jgi:ABC-2 type transport system permease protein
VNWGLLVLFCRKELRDIRSNRRVWPGYLVLPGVGILLPLLVVFLLPLMLDPLQQAGDPGIRMLIETVQRDPTLHGATTAERVARLLLRELGLWYLLMPVVLASGPAALSLVREKEQRTLEPILATPLTDQGFVLSKLIGALGPALLWTWVSAIAGYAITAVFTGIRLGVVIGPTPGNLVAIALLAPALAAAASLAAIAASAKFTDSQSANLFTGVVIVPATLILLAVLGRPAMVSAWIGIAGFVVVMLICLALYGRALRRLRREELLTSWR